MKARAIRREQHASFAAHCFTDQETFCSRHSQGGGVKLHIFGVDNARSGAVRHRQAITARARRVGGVAVDASQATGGQDGSAAT